MGADSLSHNGITYNAAITACEPVWQRARLLLDEVRRARITPDVISFSASISALAYGQQSARALALLTTVERGQLCPLNRILYNATIHACARSRDWAMALDMVHCRMPAHTITPDVISYNALMTALTNGGKCERALRVFDAMPTRDDISYATAISASGVMWQRALHLLVLMQRARVCEQHAVQTDGTAVSPTGCSGVDKYRKENGADTVASARRSVAYNAALSVCEKAGMWAVACGLLSTMQQIEVLPDVVAYNAVLTVCAKDDLAWCAAGASVLAQMRELGVAMNAMTITTVLRAWRSAATDGTGAHGERRQFLVEEQRDAVRWANGVNELFVGNSCEAVELLQAFGRAAPMLFQARVRDRIFDVTVTAIRDDDEEGSDFHISDRSLEKR
eukprot:GEMP01002887.1.p1 GENE.GEMP01002887.1~~GEMP01002887.1.p1  ORF type:complete len:391 (+),score=117.99 GEMP01002887.1:2738-3910(+)